MRYDHGISVGVWVRVVGMAFLWVCGLGLLVWHFCGCVVSVVGMAFLWVCGLGMLVWRCCGWVG